MQAGARPRKPTLANQYLPDGIDLRGGFHELLTLDQVAFGGGAYDWFMSLPEKLHPDRFTAMNPNDNGDRAGTERSPCTRDLLYTKVIDERAAPC